MTGKLELNPLSRRNDNPWDRTHDPLWLLTTDEFKQLPDGVILTTLNYESIIIGVDYIDDDTRYGMMAVGLRESQLQDIPFVEAEKL